MYIKDYEISTEFTKLSVVLFVIRATDKFVKICVIRG